MHCHNLPELAVGLGNRANGAKVKATVEYAKVRYIAPVWLFFIHGLPLSIRIYLLASSVDAKCGTNSVHLLEELLTPSDIFCQSIGFRKWGCLIKQSLFIGAQQLLISRKSDSKKIMQCSSPKTMQALHPRYWVDAV